MNAQYPAPPPRMSRVVPLTLTCQAILSVLLAAASTAAQKIQPDVHGGPGWVQTETSISSSGSPSDYISPVTFNVSVLPAACGVNDAVSVYDNGTPIGSAKLNATGLGSFTTSGLTVGTHTITAKFPGNIVNGETCLSSSYTIYQVVNSVPTYQGYINPKYVVIGVEYSPPGSSSTVMYTNDTVVGTTASTSNSFNNKTTTSVSLSGGASMLGFFGGKVTTTVSASYAQQSGSSNSVAVSQTTSSSQGISGYTDPVTGLNHNYDKIRVWLNPVAIYTVAQGGSNTIVQFNGYGYDLADTRVFNDLDVIGIQMGCLNGYFAAHDPTWLPTCQDYAGYYARTWAQNNVDGSGPGLTSADLQNILEADPFWTSYTPTPRALGDYTTVDGRFTECHGICTVTIPFGPNDRYTYEQGYSTTTINTQNYSHTQTFAVDQSFTSTAFWGSFKLSLQTENETTWVYSTSDAVNNSNGQKITLNIVGPDPGYSGPIEFVSFQDNYFGTLMLFP